MSRVCSQLGQPDDSASEMNERQEGCGEFVVARGDASELFDAAQAYLQAKQAVDSADEVLEAARRALVGLARHPREQGAGVSVVRLWKAGNVDYKAIPELKGLNLDRYRGKGREEVRVTLMK